MGAFTCMLGVAASDSGPFLEVEALVDTGAFYTGLPRSLMERLGVTPYDTCGARVNAVESPFFSCHVDI